MRTVRLVPPGGDGVAHLILDRPDRRNALAEPELDALCTLIPSVPASGARALVLRSTGQAFCAGADVDELRRLAGGPPAERAHGLRRFMDAVLALVRCPVPTLAAVQGPCLGAGACLALACDQLVAGPEARLGLVMTSMGLPGSTLAAPWLLARRVPTRTAWRLLAGAATLDAADALSLGLVDRVVPGADLERVAQEQAAAWADAPVAALSATKRALLELEGAGRPLEEQAERALEDMVAAFESPELRGRLGVNPR